jgi:hypothetical protein
LAEIPTDSLSTSFDFFLCFFSTSDIKIDNVHWTKRVLMHNITRCQGNSEHFEVCQNPFSTYASSREGIKSGGT